MLRCGYSAVGAVHILPIFHYYVGLNDLTYINTSNRKLEDDKLLVLYCVYARWMLNVDHRKSSSETDERCPQFSDWPPFFKE